MRNSNTSTKRKIGVGHFEATQRMVDLVTLALDNGRLSYGPLSREFEAKFADLHGCRFGVLSNSGTSSLQVALQAMKELHGWQEGDEVIVPALTFVATVNVVLHNRMTPVLVDIDPDYYELDIENIGTVLTDKSRAVIPVHLFGQPCDMSHLKRHARAYELKVIEDSCECMFAHHNKKPAGAWGDVACFSMYVAHILTAGVGGIATTNDPDYAAKMRSLVNHGRDGVYISIDDDDGLDAAKLREVVSRRFNFESVGHSFRITELEAALALAQLETWQENIASRQWNAALLYSGLWHLRDRLQLPEVRPHTSHSFMLFPVILREGDKWDLCNFLEQRGVETREMMRLTDQPVYKGMWDPEDYPVADWINRQGFYIGCHPGLSLEDIEYMVECFEEYFK